MYRFSLFYGCFIRFIFSCLFKPNIPITNIPISVYIFTVDHKGILYSNKRLL